MPAIETRPGPAEAREAELRDVGLGPDLVIEAPSPGSAFEGLGSLASLVRQPPALQSEETLRGALQDFVAEEIEFCRECSFGEFAYRIADLIVHRQAEVSASGDDAAARGLAALGELARMSEHIFMARGAAALG